MFIVFFRNALRVSGIGQKTFDIHLSSFVVAGLLLLEYGLTLESLLWPLGALLVAYGLHEAARQAFARRFLQTDNTQVIFFPYGSTWSSVPGSRFLDGQPTHIIILFASVGPFFNLLCAFLFALLADWFTRTFPFLHDGCLALFNSNLLFGLLCLLPVPNLNGGTLLEETLAARKVERARLRVARVGQVTALVVIAVSLMMTSITGIFLGGLLFFSSVKTFLNQTACQSLQQSRARELMRPAASVDVLEHGTKLSQALNIAKTSLQDFFPVVHGEELVGVLERNKLITHRIDTQRDEYITALTSTEFITVGPEDILAHVIDLEMLETNAPLIVTQDKIFLGIIVVRPLIEILLIENQFQLRQNDDDLEIGEEDE